MLLFPDSPLALLLLGGLLLDLLAGDMPALFRRLPHPVAALGALIGWLEPRLNRPRRGDSARFWRGVLLAGFICCVAGGTGLALAGLTRLLPSLPGQATEIFLVGVLLAQRSLFHRVAAVGDRLDRHDLPGSRAALRHLVGRDPETLDRHGVARAAIESLAENFADGVVAPALWYLLLGLPGLFLYKAVNTLDSMVGYRSPRFLFFGRASARLDDGLNFLPARLSGLLLGGGSLFVPGCNMQAALRTMWRDGPKHVSPNAGWTEAAMAGALGCALHGPRVYGHRLTAGAWLGDGTAKAEAADLRRAGQVYRFAGLIFAILVALAALLTG